MKKYEKEAIKTVYLGKINFLPIFNHKRRFFKEDFLEGFDDQTKKLKEEGWDHTVTLDIKVVQSDETKVHLLLHQSRRNSENIEYHNFHTLWIMTKVEGKWGIQFRSSFLDKASQTKNII